MYQNSVQSLLYKVTVSLVIFSMLLIGPGAPLSANTNIINTSVTVPDHPGTVSHNPTSMKDIQAADPGSNISLIEPPQVSNTGDARLFYPIEVPPGRNGLQPQLNLTYNSSGGNGWLGMNWDLTMPAITIETRWGVPRYADEFETETYLLNGEQLTPIVHRTQYESRVLTATEKIYHTRVEGQFNRIVRRGNGPQNYSWEVVAKDGTSYFYGNGPDATENNFTLGNAGDGGDIFKWALREVHDLHGNRINYDYQFVCDTGLADGKCEPGADGKVDGYQLYPTSITYTGGGDAPGAYTVSFIRDTEQQFEADYARRADAMIDARGGFKMVTAELLKRVEVRFNGDLIRGYELIYDSGAFEKTLLISIAQYGEDSEIFHTHSFTYYDEITDQSGENGSEDVIYNGFDQQESWITHSDSLDSGESAINSTEALYFGGHLNLSFNFPIGSKYGSAGGKIGFSLSNNDGVLTLIDLNGDNLPDKVFRRDGQTWIRYNQSGPQGTNIFTDTASAVTTHSFLNESSETISGGPELFLIANVFLNVASTFTESQVYFSDVNGDGLVDIVNNGQALFNYVSVDGRIPAFDSNSSLTPVPIITGTVNTSNMLPDYSDKYEERLNASPLQDTLIRWVAPFSGNIQVGGDVSLIEDTSDEREVYETADGIRVAIQHNGGEIWTTTIGPDDYAPKTPENVDLISVTKGDRLYFRIQSIYDGKFDRVQWDPQITYLNVPTDTTDVNLLNPYFYQLSEDFTLVGRPDISTGMPFTGTIRLTGVLTKSLTSDNVTVLVEHNGVQTVLETLQWDEITTLNFNEEFQVNHKDKFRLRVAVDSPIDVQQIEWQPNLFYVEAEGDKDVGSPELQDEDGNYVIQLKPPYDIDLYPLSSVNGPSPSWASPITGTLRIEPNVNIRPEVPFPTIVNGTVVLTVKTKERLVGKQVITIDNGSISEPSFQINVTEDELLYFEFSTYDFDADKNHGALFSQINTEVCVHYDINSDCVPSTFHSTVDPDVFAQPYRGWAYAGYNGNGERAENPIVEDDLNFDDIDPDQEDKENIYNPGNAKAYVFFPLPEENTWRGSDDLGWVRAGFASSSRLGADYIRVPTEDDITGGQIVQAVPRMSDAFQTAVGAGLASFVSGSTLIEGTSRGVVDYFDMNGDGYPDVLGTGQIQYTLPIGSLETMAIDLSNYGYQFVRASQNNSKNFGIGANSADANIDSGGENEGSDNQMPSIGFSFSQHEGGAEVQYDHQDINGDGLPDRLSIDPDDPEGRLYVAFNLGYRFAEPEVWGISAVNSSDSEGNTLGGGFNTGIYDFAGSISGNTGTSVTGLMLTDINGDGLSDRIIPGEGLLRVLVNTGNGFTQEAEWLGAITDQISKSTTDSVDGGVYFAISIGPVCLGGCYIIINPGVSGGESSSTQEVTLQDINGDGYVDHLVSTDEDSIDVALNNTGRTNLLKSISRPLGATIDLEYERDGNTYDQPQSRWVLSKVTVKDGYAEAEDSDYDGVDTLLTTYRYENGFYDRLEREFYGYEKVIEEHRKAEEGGALYRSIEREFLNDSYYTKGLLRREMTFNQNGNPFTETENFYQLRAVDDMGIGLRLTDTLTVTATAFPELIRMDMRYYEGQPTPGKQTSMIYTYDAFGNIATYVDTGDMSPDDDVWATLDYSACNETYVVGMPVSIRVESALGLLRQREAAVDCATGNVTQVRQYLLDGQAAVTDLAYYDNGNLRQVTGPANQTGQRYQLNYEYDPVVQTHVTKITDSFGYSSTATHNYKYGAVETTTDLNNNPISYVYDMFGRVDSITGPYGQEHGGPPLTIDFEYHHDAALPWAITRHADPFRSPTDTIDTILFIDGLKRVIQTKKDGTIYVSEADNTAQDVMIVSGRVMFDYVGRTVEQRYPVTEPPGTPGVFNETADPVEPTETTYDWLDRITRVEIPDETATTMAYGFGPDRNDLVQFQTIVTDANEVQKASYSDVRELIVGVQEFNTLTDGAVQEIWTSYAYDPLRQIVEVRDNHDNRTAVLYDNFGRRTEINNPDMGRVTTVYDLASNVIAKITPNLRSESEEITYQYDFNRLARINYPDFAGNNVTYTYGEPGAADNRAGRITLVTDESGTEERFYGKLGEITKQTRTVIRDRRDDDQFPTPKVYTTHYLYDTWGRLQRLIYPPGPEGELEILRYRYDSGGQVTSAIGTITQGSDQNINNYVTRLEYDKFEQRVYMEMGNGQDTNFDGVGEGVITRYDYDPLDRRLATLQAGMPQQNPFQNLQYGYDDVGNVLSLVNDVTLSPQTAELPLLTSEAYTAARLVPHVGRSEQTFAYDDLYRLITAEGSYQFTESVTDQYRLTMAYDTIHNITYKHQRHEIVFPTHTDPQEGTTYEWRYHYDASQPHAPSLIEQNLQGWQEHRSYSYDTNGNQDGYLDHRTSELRRVVWDEENRVQSVFDEHRETSFKYNDAGERVLKQSEEGYTAYVNQFYTDRNEEQGTNHVFIGTTRIAASTLVENTVTEDDDEFFYHPNHLGSTQYVTNEDGLLYEHLEYFPFGETWVEEWENAEDRQPYRFTSKELDEETGLYYYGARYYDPRTSVWQSPDPLLVRDLTLGGGDSFFLNPYTYTRNNPVKYIDPNGQEPQPHQSVWERIWAGVGGAITIVGGAGEFLAGVGLTAGTQGIAAVPGLALAGYGLSEVSIGAMQVYTSVTGGDLEYVPNSTADLAVVVGSQAAGFSRKQTEIGRAVTAGVGALKGQIGATKALSKDDYLEVAKEVYNTAAGGISTVEHAANAESSEDTPINYTNRRGLEPIPLQSSNRPEINYTDFDFIFGEN